MFLFHRVHVWPYITESGCINKQLLQVNFLKPADTEGKTNKTFLLLPALRIGLLKWTPSKSSLWRNCEEKHASSKQKIFPSTSGGAGDRRECCQGCTGRLSEWECPREQVGLHAGIRVSKSSSHTNRWLKWSTKVPKHEKCMFRWVNQTLEQV